MIYINNESLNPYFNLALEEYLLKESDEEIFILWQNDNTIVVGKNQNTIAEINSDFVSANNISVVRRLTGGGAVYHDIGNLNFTYIVNSQGKKELDFKKFTKPIIDVLKKLGVKAYDSGRNDILVDGCKVSGNAQTSFNNRILHHGTLLFKSDMSKIAGALNVNNAKLQSKGIKSVKSRVTNISKYLSEDLSVSEFKNLIIDSFGFREYKLSENDIEEVTKLSQNKYSTWEWNYGNSPKYNFRNIVRFDGGLVEIILNVENGTIRDAHIYGDFFGTGDVSDIEKALIGVNHNTESIKKAISGVDFDKYFLNIGIDDFLELIEA